MMENRQQADHYPVPAVESLDSFYDYLCEVQARYQDAVPHLRQELHFIMSDNLSSLNESLKTQQVLLLQMRGFERQVTHHQNQLGLEGPTLSQAIAQLPQEQRPRFLSLLAQMKETLQEVKFYQEKCSVLLQSKLYQIDKTLAGLKLPKENTLYNQNAAEIHLSPHAKTFEKKI